MNRPHTLAEMSQRLAELQRQRALLKEHLAWLEREIGAEMLSNGGPQDDPTTRAKAMEAASRRGAPAGRVAATAPQPVAAPAGPGFTTASRIEGESGAPGTTLGPNDNPDAILQQFRVEPESLREDVRKGCFLYFALAFVLLGAGIAILYLGLRR